MRSINALSLALACCAAAACKPASTETAADVVIVSAKPRCKKIGVVEGAGGDAQHAKADALEQAAERGATHILLDSPYPDLQNGIVTIVAGTIFACPPADEVFPPIGYP